MSATRVTASQLFTLADSVTHLAGRAAATQQQNVHTTLNEALRFVLDAARSAAFNEAQATHNAASTAPGTAR